MAFEVAHCVRAWGRLTVFPADVRLASMPRRLALQTSGEWIGFE